jgi:hypothetical protein
MNVAVGEVYGKSEGKILLLLLLLSSSSSNATTCPSWT